MKVSVIRKYAGIMEELGLTGLEITEDNKVVRLERNPAPSTPVTYTAPAAAAPAAVPQAEKAEGANLYTVKSPMVGVFYAAPAENAEAYVSLGDKVSRGQTLCIIEAMKLMNEIPSEEEGTIAEICVTNGQVVEYGTELFKIRRN